ncbi:hypothetical protein DSO57_1025779 [Entomophthora muscae]|uniref:Uncharacterized protein n=1 Tax=Entomophthora muscae TaxID=34485 RepID=A0ACC2TPN1_9FUNG|nr:hypothetical protein DSO57_1025779 [Entomophthora muscae]
MFLLSTIHISKCFPLATLLNQHSYTTWLSGHTSLSLVGVLVGHPPGWEPKLAELAPLSHSKVGHYAAGFNMQAISPNLLGYRVHGAKPLGGEEAGADPGMAHQKMDLTLPSKRKPFQPRPMGQPLAR